IRRRFDQNQRDCLFTIMSLLPELSEQVLREVDVERLIAELRAIHKSPAPVPKATPIPDGPASENVWSSSSTNTEVTSGGAGESENTPASHEGSSAEEPLSPSRAESGETEHANANSEDHEGSEPGGAGAGTAAVDVEEAGPAKRTKVEIWEDIKIQSFARTLIAL
ncbi:peroxin, partial [Dipsacomyces acuminosporus]